jgi:hypothetical protein
MTHRRKPIRRGSIDEPMNNDSLVIHWSLHMTFEKASLLFIYFDRDYSPWAFAGVFPFLGRRLDDAFLLPAVAVADADAGGGVATPPLV